jgi:hypothetical protein
VAEAHGFIDGDLIEVYLDLPRPQQEEVLGLLQVGGWMDGCGRGASSPRKGWMGAVCIGAGFGVSYGCPSVVSVGEECEAGP